MILDIILNIMYLVVLALTYPIRTLADVSLSSTMAENLRVSLSYMDGLDAFAPIYSAIVPIFLLFLAFETGFFAYKIIMWTLRRLPFQS